MVSVSVDPTKCPIGRQNVLLLGISYPCVPTQMSKHGFPEDVLTYKEPSVEQAVECVRRGILTEMDARDLARCIATEQATNTQVYTVSREIGAEYRSDRHVHCDFNARNFCQTLHKQFGKEIQFSQVILDYYWMPTGWLVTRWAKTLFQQTLPDLVRHQMLTFPSTRRPQRRSTGPPYDIDEGVVFLPFCAHVCKELVGAIHILKEYYEITFLDKKDLHGHSLWKGTMEIDADVMQTRLGKRLDQEEIYCKFRPKDIYESMEDPHVSKPDVMRILLAIKNYDDIRMVRLRPLRQHEPANVFRRRLYEHEKETGGFMGLDFELSKRLMLEMKKGNRKKNAPSIEEEKKEDDNVTEKKKYNTQTKKVASAIKTLKAIKKEEPPPEIRLPKPTLCAEVESPDPDELKRFQFFPGPARDLSTYIEPEEMAAEDEKLLQRAQKKIQRQRKNHGSKVSVPSKPKGIIFLPEDMDLVEQKRKLKPRFPPLPKEYLTFNPRLPPAPPGDNLDAVVTRSGKSDISNKVIELDWTVLPEDDGDPVQCPTLVNALDLQAASNLYHCILKGLQTRNKEVDGTERVARVDLDGREETTCFAIDESHTDYKKMTGYKLEPAEKLQDAMKKAEIPLRAIIEASHGFWEKLLDVDDRLWLAKVSISISKEPTIFYDIEVADGSIKEVLVDRVQNLNSIIRWLLLDQNEADDPSSCFRLIKNGLLACTPGLANAPIAKLAWKIEKQLNAEIKSVAISPHRTHRTRSAGSDLFLRHALEMFLGLVLPPVFDNGDAAKAMLSLRKAIERERTKLRRDVMKWLDSGKDSDDPTGEFRQVCKMPTCSAMISDNGEKTKDVQANEICARVASLRNVVSYFEEDERTVSTQDHSARETRERRLRKPNDQVEHDFLDSLAMLHGSSKGSPVLRSTACSRPSGQSKHPGQSVLATCTTKPHIRVKQERDVLAFNSLEFQSFDATVTESQQLSYESAVQTAATAVAHSMSTNEDEDLDQTITTASPRHLETLDTKELSRDEEITTVFVKQENETFIEGIIGEVIDNASTTGMSSSSSRRKHSKRKHKHTGNDSLLEISRDSPLSELSSTPESCSVKRRPNARRARTQTSVLLMTAPESRKRKTEQENNDVEESWKLEGLQPSKRFVSPSESGTNSRVASPSTSDADETTISKPIERRPRIKNQMLDILGRLNYRDDSLNRFMISAGFTKDAYTSWTEAFTKLHGSHRAAILERICCWCGSNQQFSDSSWEGMVFEVIDQNVSACNPIERAVRMEHLMFMFQETLEELRGSTAQADLKEILNHRIKTQKARNSLVLNGIHLHPPNGSVTMVEHAATSVVAAHHPIVLRTSDV